MRATHTIRKHLAGVDANEYKVVWRRRSSTAITCLTLGIKLLEGELSLLLFTLILSVSHYWQKSKHVTTLQLRQGTLINY